MLRGQPAQPAGHADLSGAGYHDPHQLRRDVAEFFRCLRALLGGAAFAYVWVPEWHKTEHGLHVHFAVGRFIARGLIARAWGHATATGLLGL